MIFVIPKEDILKQLILQLESHFLLEEKEKVLLSEFMDYAFEDCRENFEHNSNKYYYKEAEGKREAVFNPYHSVQYMMFLYYLSHNLFARSGNIMLCDKIYYLNKILHSVDILYAVELPKHFHADHPLGAVMGRAIYSDGFIFLQGCTVGGTYDKDGNLHYPVIDENVHMYSNSSILGNCHIGKNVNIGAGCIVKNQDVPEGCTVFGESPNLIIKHNK